MVAISANNTTSNAPLMISPERLHCQEIMQTIDFFILSANLSQKVFQPLRVPPKSSRLGAPFLAMSSANPLQPAPKNAPVRPLWQALNLAWELGYTIVIPLVLFALAGRYADKQFGTSPWLLLAGMALAIAVTTIALVRKFSKLIKDVNASNDTNEMNEEIPAQGRNDKNPDGR